MFKDKKHFVPKKKAKKNNKSIFSLPFAATRPGVNSALYLIITC